MKEDGKSTKMKKNTVYTTKYCIYKEDIVQSCNGNMNKSKKRLSVHPVQC